jgi:hypothetical protein
VAARETTAVVREESHLDEMRAAIRGDFERLERRRGGQQLLSAPHTRPEEPLPDEPLPEEPLPEEPLGEEPPHEDDGAGPEPPARSWLGRLLGR